MSNQELSAKFIAGIDKAIQELVQKKAMLGPSFVVADATGAVKKITAKKILKEKQKMNKS